MKASKKIIAGLVFGWMILAPAAIAAPLKWEGAPYFAMTRGMQLTRLLSDLGANYEVPVIVSSQVNDIFVGTLAKALPQSQLALLSRLYHLNWYYDGKVLYVYKSQEIKTQDITTQPIVARNLKTSLHKLGVLDHSSCQVTNVGVASTIEVTGVPICIDHVSALIKELEQGVQAQVDTAQQREDVKVFPLTYASAADANYQYRNQNVIIPGIVSVLREMSGSGSPDLASTVAEHNAQQNGQTDNGTGPQFSADPRQNAVIVRDKAVNMSLYNSLIKQLDKRQQAVEISVSIIDVNAADMNQLGIDWSANASIGGAHVQFNSNLTPASGGTLSSVVNDSGDFMMKINALEEKSQAKVLSQPSVLTLNNMQAVLDKDVTFYTKLVGEKIAQLASVTSGTLMQVTPRIISSEQGNNQILLNLSIEDGSQTPNDATNTDGMPLVHNSEIDTQASLKPGQSLLLGGFVQDQSSVVQRKIPLLGDLPGVGKLFSSTENSKSQVVRLFLIKAVPLQVN